jgi:hypothetical protein
LSLEIFFFPWKGYFQRPFLSPLPPGSFIFQAVDSTQSNQPAQLSPAQPVLLFFPKMPDPTKEQIQEVFKKLKSSRYNKVLI